MRPILWLGIFAALPLAAQQPTLSGPVEAYTFDAPTRSLRAVIGFPGAASFGPPLIDNLQSASVAPKQTYAIGVLAGQATLIAGLDTQKVSTAVLAGVAGILDFVTWSGNGSVAVLYSASGHWFQAVSGLPSAPQAAARVDFSNLSGSLTALALNSDGSQVALAISGDSGGVYQSTNGGALVRLQALANPVSLSFSSDGKTLYVLDAATDQINAINLSGSGFTTLGLSGVTNPIAIQAFLDSNKKPLLYVAAGTDRLLRILDPANDQVMQDVALHLAPTGISLFGSNSLVLAPRAQSNSPLWLYASVPQPGAYFVPAVQAVHAVHQLIANPGRAR